MTLDLQGFILDCTDDSAPLIQASGFGDLIVRNGQLEGGDHQTEPLIEIESPIAGNGPFPGDTTYRLEDLRLREFEKGVVAHGNNAASIKIRNVELVSFRGKTACGCPALPAWRWRTH